jgi:hypothetical protein
MSDTPEPKRRRIGTHHDWCVTVHGRDEMLLLKELAETWLCDEFVNIAVIGDEITGNDGEHAQAFFKFPQQRGVAFGVLKKMLRDAGCISAHIEPRSSRSIARAGNYCLKEHFEHIAEMFPEKGTVEELYRPNSTPLLVAGWNCEQAKPDMPTQGRRSDLEDFKAEVLAGKCNEWDTAMMNHSGLCARAEGFVRQFIGRFSPLDPMSPEEWDRLKSKKFVCSWVGWAIYHLNYHTNPTADESYGYRKVGVVTDSTLNGGTGGNTGKSYFCEWYPRLMATIGIKVQVLAPGKLADMAVQLQSDVNQVLIDIPASRSDNLQWSFVEQLKSGRVCSPKYHSTTIVLKNKPISVLILCNNHPDKKRRADEGTYTMGGSTVYNGNPFPTREPECEFTLSNDRWVEYDITSYGDTEDILNYKLPDWLPFPSEFNGVDDESDQEQSQTAGEDPPN